MMATLAAAANGQARGGAAASRRRGARRRPRRADPAHAAAAAWRPAPAVAHGLSPQAAAVILSGLSYSHRAAPRARACEQVFDARRCRDIDWLAGKTGTPSFPSDGLSLDELARLCAPGAPRRRGGAQRRLQLAAAVQVVRRRLRATPASPGPWTKAIAVLTERNWLRQSGQVHGAGDHGPNPGGRDRDADRRPAASASSPAATP